MSRRERAPERPVAPDPRYNSELVARFINKLMLGGKKSVAQSIFYDALDLIEARMGQPGLQVFEQAVRNVTPMLEVRPRRVGGATYQIPIEIRGDRRQSLALRWLVTASRNRPGKSMAQKLAAELMDAYNNTGSAVKKKEDTHRMAEANKAYSHFRW
ncbi:MAG: 30S ribosomal protein S7 [Ardenticatenaceae bacterium]|nr:30S ribosomal protein S7 [Ardenticatenaceae bacterium]HBY98899.1 30S ribosomal protein S7 [Chloroflexota bacterium]